MKTTMVVLRKILGGIFLAAAFLQWLTFDYPDMDAFKLGAGLTPGLWRQAVNWALVCLLAGIGYALFTWGRVKARR